MITIRVLHTKGGKMIPQSHAETFTESVPNKGTHFFQEISNIFHISRTDFFTVQHIFPYLVTNDLPSKPNSNSCT